MERFRLLACTLLVVVGCGGGGGGGGSAAPAPNPSVTPPTAPSGVATVVLSATSIRVTWVDSASNEDGFTVEYLIPPATTFQTAGTVAANVTQFTHSGLTASTNYTYRVKATNTGGSTASTNQAAGTTSAAPVTAPAAPSTLTATAVSFTQINLVWVDNASNEDGFKIERSTTAGSGFTQIDTVGANVVAYSSTGLTASTQYYYKVRAYNTAGDSAYSNTANATTQAASGGGSGTWVEQTLPPSLAGRNFFSIWGSSTNDVFVAGDNRAVNASSGAGIIAHYDGTNWTEQLFSSPLGGMVYGLFGFSPTNVFALRTEFSGFTNTGSILHYDGTSWTTQKTVSGTLYGPFAFSPTDIFVLGTVGGVGGIILHYDGTTWTQTTSPSVPSLQALWGSSSTNVFVVGGDFSGSSTNGVVFHYDGTTWTQQTIPTVERLVHVSGTSSTNVFAVGVNGTILHYDGTTWTQQTSGVTDTLRYVFPVSSVTAFVFGANASSLSLAPGSILQYNGTTWTNIATIAGGPIGGVWVGSSTNAFAVGGIFAGTPGSTPQGVIYRYNGTTWTQEAQPRRRLTGVLGFSATDIWAVGDESLILRRQ